MRRAVLTAIAPLVLAGCSLVLSFDEDGAGDGGGDAPPGAPLDGVAADACDSRARTATPVDPTLVVALDSSGSMGSPLGTTGSSTRIELAISALRERLAARYSRVRVGAMTFSGASSPGCPLSTSTAPTLDAGAAIDGVFASAAPNAQAPVVEALAAAGALALTSAPPGPARVLFVTDSPFVDCAGAPNVAGAIAAAQDAASAGVTTDVVVLDADLADADARALAAAGGGRMARALAPAEVLPAIEDALTAVDQCLFRAAAGGTADLAAVFLDGVALPTDAWRVDANGDLVLLDATCTSYLAGPRRALQVVGRCGT